MLLLENVPAPYFGQPLVLLNRVTENNLYNTQPLQTHKAFQVSNIYKPGLTTDTQTYYTYTTPHELCTSNSVCIGKFNNMIICSL